MEHFQRARPVIGQQERGAFLPPAELLLNGLEQLCRALAGPRRDAHRPLAARQLAETGIALVEHADAGRLLRAKLHDELLHNLRLLHPVGIGQVNHMQQQIGIFQLLQRRLKGLHQMVWQLGDETHGVGNHGGGPTRGDIEYLKENKTLNLHGFINFRLSKYIEYLDTIIDERLLFTSYDTIKEETEITEEEKENKEDQTEQ